MTEILKRCPFCGGKARIKTCECDDVSSWQVTCGNPKCFCSSALFYSTREEAVSAWNARPIDDDKVKYEPTSYSCRACKNATDKEVKRLREALEEISRGFDTDSWYYTREGMMRIAKEALKGCAK